MSAYPFFRGMSMNRFWKVIVSIGLLILTCLVGMIVILGYSEWSGSKKVTYVEMEYGFELDRYSEMTDERSELVGELVDVRADRLDLLGKIDSYKDDIERYGKRLEDVKSQTMMTVYGTLLDVSESGLKRSERRLGRVLEREREIEDRIEYLGDALSLSEYNQRYYEELLSY